MDRKSNKKEFSLLTNVCNCRKHCINAKLNMLQWDIDDLSFDPNVVHVKHKRYACF